MSKLAQRQFAPIQTPATPRTTMGGMKKRGPARKASKHGKDRIHDPADIAPRTPDRRKHQRWARQRPGESEPLF